MLYRAHGNRGWKETLVAQPRGAGLLRFRLPEVVVSQVCPHEAACLCTKKDVSIINMKFDGFLLCELAVSCLWLVHTAGFGSNTLSWG